MRACMRACVPYTHTHTVTHTHTHRDTLALRLAYYAKSLFAGSKPGPDKLARPNFVLFRVQGSRARAI
jgi:hypothetical protein